MACVCARLGSVRSVLSSISTYHGLGNGSTIPMIRNHYHCARGCRSRQCVAKLCGVIIGVQRIGMAGEMLTLGLDIGVT